MHFRSNVLLPRDIHRVTNELLKVSYDKTRATTRYIKCGVPVFL